MVEELCEALSTKQRQAEVYYVADPFYLLPFLYGTLIVLDHKKLLVFNYLQLHPTLLFPPAVVCY